MRFADIVLPFVVLMLLLILILMGLVHVGIQRQLNSLVLGLASGLVGVVAVSLGIYVTLGELGFVGDRTPTPPNTITDPTDALQRDSVMAYARRLVFTDSTIHGATDKQFLDVVGVDQVTGDTVPMPGGPLATISPEENSHRNKRSDLEGIGRILAQIIVHDTSGYLALGLPAGTSYVWVGDLRVNGDSGQARGYIVPENLAIPVQATPTPILYKRNADRHGESYGWSNAVAKWTFSPYDAGTWFSCERHGCCQGLQ